MDPLWSEVLGVQQDLHALVTGFLLGDQGTADLYPEEGLLTLGQQFRVRRLRGLQGLASDIAPY